MGIAQESRPNVWILAAIVSTRSRGTRVGTAAACNRSAQSSRLPGLFINSLQPTTSCSLNPPIAAG